MSHREEKLTKKSEPILPPELLKGKDPSRSSNSTANMYHSSGDSAYSKRPAPLTDVYRNVANTFWRPSLSFNTHKYGDPLVDFGSLWAEGKFSNFVSSQAQDYKLKFEQCKLGDVVNSNLFFCFYVIYMYLHCTQIPSLTYFQVDPFQFVEQSRSKGTKLKHNTLFRFHIPEGKIELATKVELKQI